jgi:hypothetical protein
MAGGVQRRHPDRSGNQAGHGKTLTANPPVE